MPASSERMTERPLERLVPCGLRRRLHLRERDRRGGRRAARSGASGLAS